MKHLWPFIAGVVFAVGLVLGGMTQPAKVIGFLDFTGNWDPSLMLVMGGAVAVHFVLFRLILRRQSPLYSPAFHVPGQDGIDRRLLVGSALFGAGWGLAGYCPGPAIVASASGSGRAWVFTAAMLAGMAGFQLLTRRSGGETKAASQPLSTP